MIFIKNDFQQRPFLQSRAKKNGVTWNKQYEKTNITFLFQLLN